MREGQIPDFAVLNPGYGSLIEKLGRNG